MSNPKWLGGNSLLALLIGVLVLANTYLLLERVLGLSSSQARQAGGVFAGAAGLLTALFLMSNPGLLQQVSTELVLGLIGLLLAMIALLKRRTG